MLNKEVTEMNNIRKISRETSAPSEPGIFNLHFGICGDAVNVLARHMNLLSYECIELNEDKNYGKKNYCATIHKMR